GGLASGSMSEGELNRLVQERAKAGALLTVLGFGSETVKEGVLGNLADLADGSYAAIDSRKTAEKTLVQQVNGTLYMVAKDVKIQVEFNPAVVSSYRLIGYENRALKK